MFILWLSSPSQPLQVMKIEYINKRPTYAKAVVSVIDHVECRCQPAPRPPVPKKKSSRRQHSHQHRNQTLGHEQVQYECYLACYQVDLVRFSGTEFVEFVEFYCQRSRCTLKMNSTSGMSWSKTRGPTWRISWSSSGAPEETHSLSLRKATAWQGRMHLALERASFLVHTGHITPPGSLGLKTKLRIQRMSRGSQLVTRLFPHWIMMALRKTTRWWKVGMGCCTTGLKGQLTREEGAGTKAHKHRVHHGKKTNPTSSGLLRQPVREWGSGSNRPKSQIQSLENRRDGETMRLLTKWGYYRLRRKNWSRREKSSYSSTRGLTKRRRYWDSSRWSEKKRRGSEQRKLMVSITCMVNIIIICKQ